MSAPRLACRRETLPLDPPLENAKRRWDRRETLRIVVCCEDGSAGEGEASPLPGYSLDRLEECHLALSQVDPSALDLALSAKDPGAIAREVARLVPARLPAARFGLETALLDLAARRRRMPLWRWLRDCEWGAASGAAAAPSVRLCALLPGGAVGSTLARAHALSELGVDAFKLKVGPGRLLAAQRGALSALRDELGPAAQLRLDANGSLDASRLRATLEELARFDPELLEEPLPDVAGSARGIPHCPIALDESLAPLSASSEREALGRGAWAAVVLKPTSLGGVGRCLRLARRAREVGVSTIVSHAFEGPIGWHACAHLALALDGPRAAGLWPRSHQLPALERIAGGRLVAPEEPGLGVTRS